VGVGVSLGCGHTGHARKPYSHVVVGWVKRGSEMRSAVSHANPKATKTHVTLDGMVCFLAIFFVQLLLHYDFVELALGFALP
jgi:hypothetical protein